jgi:hypothetical protein
VRRDKRAESREQRAESREQRAESREQRAESREQRAERKRREGYLAWAYPVASSFPGMPGTPFITEKGG